MDQSAAGYEYILGVKWLPDNRAVAVRTTNRLQTARPLARLARHGSREARPVRRRRGVGQPEGAAVSRRRQKFVVSSERDGHTHLYLYSIDSKLLNAVTHDDWSVRGPSGFYGAPLGSAWVDGRAAGSTSRRSRSLPFERHSTHPPDGTGMERLEETVSTRSR
jgi:hypothetical protein